MRCLIVLWSENSLKSPWVLEEAEEARRLEKLLFPVLIEHVAPPVGFRAIQAANLIDWDGSADTPAVPLLIADLKALLGDAKRPMSKPQVADDIWRAPAREAIALQISLATDVRGPLEEIGWWWSGACRNSRGTTNFNAWSNRTRNSIGGAGARTSSVSTAGASTDCDHHRWNAPTVEARRQLGAHAARTIFRWDEE